MKTIFHAFFGLVFLVFDTARLPFSPPFGVSVDLCLIYVLFVIFSRPIKEAAAVAAFLGLGMDSFSGGPFGLYFTIYLWLVFAFSWIPVYADAENGIFTALATACGVLIQGFFFFAAASLASRESAAFSPDWQALCLSALFAAPVGYWAMAKLRALYSRIIGRKDRTEPRIYLGDSNQDRLD